MSLLWHPKLIPNTTFEIDYGPAFLSHLSSVLALTSNRGLKKGAT